jgi:2-polyprenyl-3-methyl-5-hydroxy-6-metoxy-1,4-benzoquinol methylase/tetratricopeptide (TPR) repeat protein
MIDEGNALEEQGRTAEAMARYDAAVQADPRCARAHLNRGNILLAGGQIDQARSAYQLAIACDPRYAAAHFNLGNLNCQAGDNERGLQNYQAATGINPEFADAFIAMGNTLDTLGRASEAMESYERALQVLARNFERMPTSTIKTAFGACVPRTRFTTDDPRIRAALTAAITEPWWFPHELCWRAISLVMLNPRIASSVRLANERWPARPPKVALFGTEGLATLAADSLLLALLAAAPVSDLEFERFLTTARQALLETAATEQQPDPFDIAGLPFYAALTRQCFINEYIFDCDDGERATAVACRTKLLALLDAQAVVPPLLLLAVAAYFPLYTLPAPGRLLTANQQGPVDDVLRQQVREPLEEAALRASVKCLTSITHGVSEKVRAQYEQNPYPRWVKLPMIDAASHLNAELRRSFPLARYTPIHDDSQPDVLIAGCGTGRHSILAARRFRGAQVLAVDLSLNSISYALRKTRELGITNIEYAQADILKLGELTRTFDIIESVGVLHHLSDPFAGWQTLLSRLRPGGLMHLGFYSQLARKHLVRAREFVAARGYTSTPDDIRRFRRDLAARTSGAELQWLSRMSDFYSTSECRDLVFHVQEHCLTLDQIESFMSEFGLNFIGFELDASVLHQYRTRFAGDPAATSLRNWTRFEADNPDTFVGMYQFWIQKPTNLIKPSALPDSRVTVHFRPDQ